jgi:hypothetical protein
MAVVSIAGSQFTVTYNSQNVSAQVTEGTITATPTITRTKTLAEVDFQLTDLVHEVECTFLYDEETGFYGAINTAAIAGTGVTVSIVGGDAKWDGTLYCQGLEVSFAADGVATASGSFIGSLTLADAP